VTTRRYDNSRRTQQAAETTARILRTAHDLLLADGYQAMTVASLAAAAGVSPQTVYNSVGGKAAVVKAVYDLLVVGDPDPVPVSSRPTFRAIVDTDDGVEMLRRYARHCRGLQERIGPLLGVLLAHGPGGDPVLEEFVATIEEERRTGNRVVLTAFLTRQRLPGGLSRRRAADLLWTLTAPEVGDRLVRRCGWSPAEFEQWLGDAMVSALVAD
jgi:AcrR family transcriptional regulator